jgi:hypothetical protein
MTPVAERVRAAAIAARNLLIGGNVTTLTLRSPRAMVHYASETLFLRRALAGDRGLPERQVWEVLPAGPDVAIRLASVQADGWPARQPSYIADIVNLCRICAALQPRRVFEIGTSAGFSTLHLALNSPGDVVVHTLDLPRADPTADGGGAHGAAPVLRTTLVDDAHIRSSVRGHSYLFSGSVVRPRIELLYGDSATFDFGPYRGDIDLFFIDGAHSYAYVRSDTERALTCVRPGGVIAWHDFGRVGLNGVSRWLLEMRAAGWPVFAAPGGSLAFMVVPGEGPTPGDRPGTAAP